MKHLRGFFDAQTTEEAQLDDATLSTVHGGQRFQCAIERQKVNVCLLRSRERFVKRDVLHAASALLISVGARVIDEHSPHQTRRDAEEMRTILPPKLSCIGESDKGFVDERGRLERVIFALAPHIAAGQTAQLRFDQRRQSFERALVAVAPRPEQVGHSPWRVRRDHVSDLIAQILRRERCFVVQRFPACLIFSLAARFFQLLPSLEPPFDLPLESAVRRVVVLLASK